jgi:hypothetical protein
MDDDAIAADSSEDGCPFCGSTGACAHLLLIVDTTLRHAEGGLLMAAFNARWSACFQDDDDINEQATFDALLEDVDSLADAMSERDHDGGPGMSSAYAAFFVGSEARAQAAVNAFNGGGL